MPGWLVATWSWFQASDPGLSRLRMAGSAAIAMASALAIELIFARAVHADYGQLLVAMILGALVAMLGSMALTATVGGALAKVLTAVFFPVVIGAGMFIGVAVAGRTDLMLTVFVVVMFVAVYVRRFGVAFFFYGFMFWLGYFFASFLDAKLAMMPFLMAAVVLGGAWVLLLSLTVLRVNPTRALQRTINAFDARARGVVWACAELLQCTDATDARTRRRLYGRVQGQERRLVEAALMVEGWAAEPATRLAAGSAAALRGQLIGAQQALDALVITTQQVAGSDGEYHDAVERIARRLAYRRDAEAVRLARKLKRDSDPRKAGCDRTDGETDVRRAVYRFAKAAIVFVSLARAARRLRAGGHDSSAGKRGDFEPTAALIMGNLPGSPSVARGLSARGARWNPLARLDLTSRQAIQVALAGGLAILLGRLLSPTRYYWAVIAAFVMFSGTATRSETFLKGLNRVIGTALGLTAAVGLAELTVGHPWAIVATIILSMFCGFYLLRVSYAYMIFFVTIMVAQLYTVLHEFTPGLLVLRLEETAIGAGLGFAVALVFMPLSTRDTVRSARRDMLLALETLLRRVASRLDSVSATVDDGDAANKADTAALYALSRTLDDAVRRFALVIKPLTQPLLGAGKHVTARHRLSRYAAIATNARALIVAVDERTEPTAQPDLATVCRSLAAAAEQLAECGPGRAESAMAALLEEADVALVHFDPAQLHGDALEHVIDALRRLHFLLKSLGSVG